MPSVAVSLVLCLSFFYCISDFTTLRGNVNRKFEGRLMGSGFKVAVRRIKFIKRREVYIMRLHDGYQSNSSKEKQAVCDSCHEIGGAFAEK